MKLKEIQRRAVVAWSPSTQHPDLIAMGTMSGNLDASFSSSAVLEIFPLRLAHKEVGLKSLGSASSSQHFQKLAWGVRGTRGAGVSGGRPTASGGGGDDVAVDDPEDSFGSS